MSHQDALSTAINLTYPHGYKLLYLTEYGSTLYGTNSETSDVDFKGVYVPSVRSMLLKKDKYNLSTPQTQEKNNPNDIDMQLYSIHMFMDLLEKGEGSAIEMLFSIFREDSIVYIVPEFKQMIENSWKYMISKKLNHYIGYCLGQTKKYGIKGERLSELDKVINFLKENISDGITLRDFRSELKYIIDTFNLEFVKFVFEKDGSGVLEVEYLEVLGRKFGMTVKMTYILERLHDVQKDYGLRTKKASCGIATEKNDKILSELNELEKIMGF